MEHKSLSVLKSGIVIDKSQMPSDPGELALLLAFAYSDQSKPVLIVANASSFFSSANLIKVLETGDSSWTVIVEKFDLSISPSDIDVIKRSVEIRKEIVEKLKPAYQFADIPNNWVIGQRLQISQTTVRRAYNNPEGDNTEYDLPLETLKSIWLKASRHWKSDEATSINGGAVSVNYSFRIVTIKPKSITIGCQIVRRYELEALALHQHWDFPSA